MVALPGSRKPGLVGCGRQFGCPGSAGQEVVRSKLGHYQYIAVR